MFRPTALEDANSDPFSDQEIALMLAAAGIDATLETAQPVETGANAVYELELVDNGGNVTHAFFKAATTTGPETFRHEPERMQYVRDQTDIPVPEVFGTHLDPTDLPAPSYVMEAADGYSPGVEESRNGTDDYGFSEDLRPVVVRQVGEHLAALHDTTTLDGVGRVVTNENPSVVAPAESWETWLGDLLEAADMERLDLASERVRSFVQDGLDSLPSVDPVPLHYDYQPKNVVVDESSGTVIAVLDWGEMRSGHDEYELALTEHYFSKWAPVGSDRRRQVRKALWKGYGRRRDINSRTGVERRRKLYLTISTLSSLAWAEYWPSPVATQFRRNQQDLVTALVDGL